MHLGVEVESRANNAVPSAAAAIDQPAMNPLGGVRGCGEVAGGGTGTGC